MEIVSKTLVEPCLYSPPFASTLEPVSKIIVLSSASDIVITVFCPFPALLLIPIPGTTVPFLFCKFIVPFVSSTTVFSTSALERMTSSA